MPLLLFLSDACAGPLPVVATEARDLQRYRAPVRSGDPNVVLAGLCAGVVDLIVTPKDANDRSRGGILRTVVASPHWSNRHTSDRQCVCDQNVTTGRRSALQGVASTTLRISS